MFVISVMVMFAASAMANGVNVPQSGIEGPLLLHDEDNNLMRFETLQECMVEAHAHASFINDVERHVHGTNDLTVFVECEREGRGA